MRILSYIGLLAGLVVLTLLLAWGGIAEVLHLLVSSGWSLLWLPLVWLPSVPFCVLSWRLLFFSPHTPPFRQLLAGILIGRAINTLLPVATIGGEFAKVRLLTLWGTNGVAASASVLVDKTVQALSLVPWGMIGFILLLLINSDHAILYPVLTGYTLLALGIIGFILVQHAGMFGGITSFFGKFITHDNWTNINNNAREIDRIVRELYRERGRFALSVFWRTLSLVLESSEVWLACYLFHHPISVTETLMIRSMVSIMNNIVFFVPNAYGVQEGAYILMGRLIGLSPEFSLALSLATRVRELIVDLPGFLAWQFIEGHHFLKRKRIASL
jgi:putative membrane protein